jgi:hypothetical protein
MKRRLFEYGLLSLILMCNSPSFSQWFEDKDSTDFLYRRDASLASSKHFRIELDPLQFGFQGGHFSMGAGGRLLAYHFVDKLSAEVSYIQRYYSILPREEPAVSQQPNLDAFKGKEFSFVLSYSLFSFIKDFDVTGVLMKRKMLNEVIRIPVTFNHHFDLRLGAMLFDHPGRTEFQTSMFIPQKLHYVHQTRSVNMGLSYKALAKDTYTTNQFGKIQFSLFHEVFLDFLYAPKAFFPEQLYTPNNWPYFSFNESLNFVLASNTIYDEVTSGLVYSPFGFQFGARTSSMRNALGFSMLLGIRPGYVSQTFIKPALERYTASIGLSYHFPLKVKMYPRNEGFTK